MKDCFSINKSVTGSPQHHIVLDVETTGLSPGYGGRVIEIGAVVIQDLCITEEFQTLINIERPIPRTVQRIHGITDKMLIGQPKLADVIPRFHDFIRGSILIAHNARFDIGFIKAEFARLHLSLNNDYLCTLQIARKRYPHLPNHKLETVARHLLKDLPENLRLHRALDDARLTARVWMEMEQMKIVEAWRPSLPVLEK